MPSHKLWIARFLPRAACLTTAALSLGAGSALAQPPAPPAAASSSVQLVTGTGTVFGTLTVPGGTAKVPVALIIAGSGPTDRDGNSPMLPGKNNMYKQLADALASAGVASLRYDKRGIAESRAAGA